ncbi:MAG: hypothetical protein WBA93_21145 [Microcoleaceae cyanobacterium]
MMKIINFGADDTTLIQQVAQLLFEGFQEYWYDACSKYNINAT